MKNVSKKEEGFTIIEVMIVLAIGALILVVVLVAIPQLQRNQRNQARQNVTSRVMTELSAYAGNNRGEFPESDTELEDFVDRYLDGVSYEDPLTGDPFEIEFGEAPSVDDGEMGYFTGSECAGENVQVSPTAGNRQIALQVELEPGDIFFCVDNQ